MIAINPSNTSLLALMWIAAMALPSCGKESSGGDGNGGGVGASPNLDPNQNNADYVIEQDSGAAQQLFDDIWDNLIRPNCWQAPGANLTQYEFFGPYRYRHVGQNDSSGGVFAESVGRYRGYPTAIVSTWTGEREGIIMLTPERFAHVWWFPNGTAVVLEYIPAGSCL